MATANYAAPQPHDKNVEPLQGYPAPIQAKATWAAPTAIATSSILNLGDSTTVLEVSAVSGTGVLLRWIKSTELAAVAPAGSIISSGVGANFDHVIPANTTRRFVVPVDPSIVVQPASVMGINGQNGLFKRVAVFTAGPVSSVLATEF